MNKGLNYILLIFVFLVAVTVTKGAHVVDKVCKDAVRTYRVNGEANLTYTWTLTNVAGASLSIPAAKEFTDKDIYGNPILGSEIQIKWSFDPAVYTLTVQKQNQYSCTIDTAGTIEVVPVPQVFAGDDLIACSGSPILMANSTTSNSSGLVWTTAGDGKFDDPTILHPVYTPGPVDLVSGNVLLTITAEGQGDEGSCIPVSDAIAIKIITIKATVNSTRVTCYGANDGTITVYDDGLAKYKYNFQRIGTTANWTTNYSATNLTPGAYLVQISNTVLADCAVTLDTIEIKGPELLTAEIQSNQPSCFGEKGSITVTGKGGWGSYQYSLNGSGWQSSGFFPNLGESTYEVLVRDASYTNCIVSVGDVTIVEPVELTATVTPTPVKCPGSNTGSILLKDLSGGSGNYEFSIDGTNWQGSSNFKNLAAGTYSVSMRDADHPKCLKTLMDVVLDDPPPIVAALTPYNASCYGTKDGKIEVAPPVNGTPPYMYSIDGINWQTDGLITGLAGAQVYTVRVRDANTCISTVGSVQILQPAKLQFKPVKTNETIAGANDGTITITAQNGGSNSFDYKFDGLPWQVDPFVSNLSPATYTVYMRDKLNPDCMIDTLITIYPAGSVSSKYSVVNISCYGGSDGKITFTNYAGATNYQFSVNGGTNWQSNPEFSGLTADSYTLMIRDLDHPTNTVKVDQIELIEPEELNATVNVTPETVAGANNAMITISNAKGGSGVYQYSLDGIKWVATTTFAGLTSGPYNVWIGDKNMTTCSVVIPKIIQPAGQLAADVSHTDVLCNGANNGSIIISNPSGTSFYEYSINGGTKWDLSGTYPGLKPGNYEVRLRDRFNTSNNILLEHVSISQPSPLRGRYTKDSEPLCAGGSGVISLFSTGGTGVKTFTNALTGAVITNMTLTVSAGEKISIIVTDENGCTDPINYTVPNPPALIVSSKVNPPQCYGDNNGSVEITASGGTGDLSIKGVKMVGVKMLLPVQAGRTYSYEVIDSNGCSSNTVSGLMPEAPSQLVVSTNSVTDVSCYGGNDGTATAVVSGGTPQYTYLWNDPAKQITPTAIGLTKGKYRVTVTDVNGCSNFAEARINEQPALTEPTASVVQPDCDISTGTITATTPVPAAGITYTLTGTNPVTLPVANTTGVFTGLTPGVYDITVTNSFGCTTAPIVKTINPHLATPANPTALPVPSACEDVPIQTLNANSGIVPPVSGTTIIWYDKAVGGNVVVSPIWNKTGSFTFYAEASNGECVSTNRTPVMLTILPRPAAPISKGNLSACESTPLGTLDARDAIDATGKNIVWYDKPVGGNVVTVPTLNAVKTVTYYAEDVAGVCSSSPRTAVTLSINPLPANPTAIVSVQPRCIDTSGIIEVTSPLGANFEYRIDNGMYQPSVTFNNQIPGDHAIQVKNIITNCESGLTHIKVQDIPPAPKIINLTVEDCICYGDSGKLNFEFRNVSDGTYVVIYLGGQFENVKVVNGKATIIAPAGIYHVLAIEANGCTSSEKWDVEIKQPDMISVSAKITEIDLKSGQKGEIDLNISGGTGAYQTIWQPNLVNGFAGATTEDIKNLDAGVYTVTVIDENKCQRTYRDTIPKANQPPIATDDVFEVTCNLVTGDLLYTDNGNGKDSDPDGDPISIDTTPVRKPSHGTLTINSDGTFEYMALQGYTGDDLFIYRIYDIKKNYSNPAMVTIHVVSDIDRDGIADDLDPDADGDGILNVDEVLPGQDWKTTDSDGDGHPNYLDIDSDNDGIVDNIEAQSTPGYIPPSGVDKDHNGIDDAYDPAQGGVRIIPVDTDGDGIPDFLDADSDNDGVPDYIEGHDLNADGKPDEVLVGKDSDGDGLDDGFDTVVNACSPSENVVGSNASMQDFDGDGLRDWRDENDDDDQYLTRFEDLNGDGDFSNDTFGHPGHPEYLWVGRDCDLFIPNAFSPNGDNIHDYFQIYCTDDYPNARMYIFDQLGNKLYEKEHYGNLEFWGSYEQAWWDGRTTNRAVTTTNGGMVAPGTYYYVLQLGNGDVKKSFVFVSY